MNVVSSLSACASMVAAIGYRRSVTSWYVSSLVPPCAIVMAVRAFSPSFPGGSLIAPQRNWMRNATRGEEGLGRKPLLIGASAPSFHVRLPVLFFLLAPAPIHL